MDGVDPGISIKAILQTAEWLPARLVVREDGAVGLEHEIIIRDAITHEIIERRISRPVAWLK